MPENVFWGFRPHFQKQHFPCGVYHYGLEVRWCEITLADCGRPFLLTQVRCMRLLSGEMVSDLNKNIKFGTSYKRVLIMVVLCFFVVLLSRILGFQTDVL